MRLLVINFQMDPESQVLGWQHRVVSDLAGHCEHVTVLTHRDSGVRAGSNVRVETFPLRLMRAPTRFLGGKWMVNPWVARICVEDRIDACFIHMNMEWAYRLYPTFARLGIPVLLWYAHGATSFRLRLAHRCVTRVVTSTAEGFRLPSTKVKIIGQGIDTRVFARRAGRSQRFEVITVGRIARTKRIHLMIEALAAARAMEPDAALRLRIIGEPIRPNDRRYARDLGSLIERLELTDHVVLAGQASQHIVAAAYDLAFVHLNLSETGSMDKSILEALATGCPVLTSNVALHRLLSSFPELIIADDAPVPIAEQLLHVFHSQAHYGEADLSRLVDGRHDADSYATRIVGQLEDLLAAQRV